MATIRITRNGKPVGGARVATESTAGFSRYNESGNTDSNGKFIVKDNANRFHIYVNGSQEKTVGSLSGTIEVNI